MAHAARPQGGSKPVDVNGIAYDETTGQLWVTGEVATRMNAVKDLPQGADFDLVSVCAQRCIKWGYIVVKSLRRCFENVGPRASPAMLRSLRAGPHKLWTVRLNCPPGS